MPPRQLSAVLHRLERVFREAHKLAEDAQRWSGAGSRPYITRRRSDSMVELAFLRSFLAWERFLEESFILYLLGKQPPRGSRPRRFAMAPDAKAAQEFVCEGRGYTTWDGSSTMTRARRFFRGGRPYTNAIEPRRHLLSEAQTIRNAIAHESQAARQRFETLVRDKLGTLPPKTTIGRFLSTQIPGSVRVESYFAFYLDGMRSVAREVVPEPSTRIKR